MAAQMKPKAKAGDRKPPEKKSAPARLAGPMPKSKADDGLVDEDTFLAHVEELQKLGAKGAKIRGEIGALVKAGESDHSIHRGASAQAIKLNRMEADARSAWLTSFDRYRKILELDSKEPALPFGDD